MKQHDCSHEYILFSNLLDKGAEIFTKKKIEHSRSKDHQHYRVERGLQDKVLAARSKSPEEREERV